MCSEFSLGCFFFPTTSVPYLLRTSTCSCESFYIFITSLSKKCSGDLKDKNRQQVIQMHKKYEIESKKGCSFFGKCKNFLLKMFHMELNLVLA